MYKLNSTIVGEVFVLSEAENVLKPLGFSIAGNWDYDHGYFDYKMSDGPGYQFIRLPFTAIEGQLDGRHCTVRFGQPFLLAHQYQDGLDDSAEPSVLSASFNQFAEPVDKDADLPAEYLAAGKGILKEAENALLKPADS